MVRKRGKEARLAARRSVTAFAAVAAMTGWGVGFAGPAAADGVYVSSDRGVTATRNPDGTITTHVDPGMLVASPPECARTDGQVIHPAPLPDVTEYENPVELADHDPEAAPLPPVVAAVELIVTHCAPVSVVVDTDEVTVNDFTVVSLNGNTQTADYQPSGGSGPAVTKDATLLKRGSYGSRFYGKQYATPDGSNFWANWFFYEARERDSYGSVRALWQSPVASIYDYVDLQRFRSAIHQQGGSAVRYEEASPLGTTDVIDTSAAITAGFTVGFQDPKYGEYIEFSASKQFNVDHTTFTGGLIPGDGNTITGTLGGYRHIAKKYQHARSRAFDQVGVWTFPPGTNMNYTMSIDFIAWCHKGRDCG